MTELDELIERLHRVEALHARTDVDGERDAAANAMQAIQARLESLRDTDAPIEVKFTMPDSWSRRLFTALLKRYGIKAYRYRGQRYTTVMARAPESFIDDTLWPQYVELDELLRGYLSEVTDRVIRQAIYDGDADVDEVAKTARLEDGR